MKPTRLTECGNWVLERFPVTKFWNDHMAHYYAPKNFNFLVLFWLFGVTGFSQPDSHRYFVDHELQTGCKTGIRFCRVHYA